MTDNETARRLIDSTLPPGLDALPLEVQAEAVVATRLVVLAAEQAQYECPVDRWECHVCNEFNRVWWNLSNALSRDTRVAFQAFMRLHGIPLPDSPWEEVR